MDITSVAKNHLARELLTEILPEILDVTAENVDPSSVLTIDIVAARDRKGYRAYSNPLGSGATADRDSNLAIRLSVAPEAYDDKWCSMPFGQFPQAPMTAESQGPVEITIEFPRKHPFADRLIAAVDDERESIRERRAREIEREIASVDAARAKLIAERDELNAS